MSRANTKMGNLNCTPTRELFILRNHMSTWLQGQERNPEGNCIKMFHRTMNNNPTTGTLFTILVFVTIRRQEEIFEV